MIERTKKRQRTEGTEEDIEKPIREYFPDKADPRRVDAILERVIPQPPINSSVTACAHCRTDIPYDGKRLSRPNGICGACAKVTCGRCMIWDVIPRCKNCSPEGPPESERVRAEMAAVRDRLTVEHVLSNGMTVGEFLLAEFKGAL